MHLDYFKLLGLPRRAGLDPTEVKTRFLELSRECHPDRVHQADAATRQAATQRHASLNAACACLTDPGKRLRHLLELSTRNKVTETPAVHPELVDVFMAIGEIGREADALLRQLAGQVPSILLVRLQLRKKQLMERISGLEADLESRMARVNERARELDAANPWREPADTEPSETAPRTADRRPPTVAEDLAHSQCISEPQDSGDTSVFIEQLAALAAEASFCGKWLGQLREWRFKLSLPA